MARYLVTGISRGIGRAVGARLCAEGHHVIGVVRPGWGFDADGVASELWQLDLADPAGFEAALGARIHEVESLDGIVHCAGVVRPGSLTSASVVDELTDQFAVNVVAIAELTRLLLPALRSAAGTLVLVNSGSGLSARPPLGGYGASKHALRGYADALRQEEPGIRVSTIFPGRTATRMQQTVQDAEGGAYRAADYLRSETVAGVICSVLALPEDGVITEVTLRPR